MDHFGQPDELQGAVFFLVPEFLSFATRTVIAVNGGFITN